MQVPAIEEILLALLALIAIAVLYLGISEVIQKAYSRSTEPQKVLIPLKIISATYRLLDQNLYICLSVQNPNVEAIDVNSLAFYTSSGYHKAELSTCGSKIDPNTICTICFNPVKWKAVEDVKLSVNGLTSSIPVSLPQ